MKGRFIGTRVMALAAIGFGLPLVPDIMSDVETTPAEEIDVEAAVCGSFREPFVFWLWRTMAGSPNPERAAQVEDVAQIRFKTRDGIHLGGYKIAATAAKGYLLVAQGNAMLADQLPVDLQSFRDLGLDVFIFDYRGYGISEGKSRLAAIVADYLELVRHLNTLSYSKRFLYGMSMGGVILLNAVGRGSHYTRLVVDSSPSHISNFGCPQRYDPVTHLPDNASRIMIISGDRDKVVKPREMDELMEVARSRGARIVREREFAHPYQDSLEQTHRRRQNEVAAFLLAE
jgi:alpha/beta superfamily hydrolase